MASRLLLPCQDDGIATDRVAIIDFEASCLPEDAASYPIEVAIAKLDGSYRTWLIKPFAAWRYWDWSEEAEQLHGISPQMLAQQGQDPCEVLRELAAEVAGYQVYADCDLDAYWLEILCQGCRTQVPFQIHYLGEYLCTRGVTRPQILSALALARQQLPEEHVARHDANRLALALRILDAA